jgi:hypothetical protein
MTACRDSTGMVLIEPTENTEQWSQHFQNLLRDPNVIGMVTQEMGKVKKNIERTEEEWDENEPPTIDVVRKG